MADSGRDDRAGARNCKSIKQLDMVEIVTGRRRVGEGDAPRSIRRRQRRPPDTRVLIAQVADDSHCDTRNFSQ